MDELLKTAGTLGLGVVCTIYLVWYITQTVTKMLNAILDAIKNNLAIQIGTVEIIKKQNETIEALRVKVDLLHERLAK